MIQLTSHKKSSLDLQCILRSPGICSQQSSKALNAVRFCYVTRVGKSLSLVSDPLPQIFVRASKQAFSNFIRKRGARALLADSTNLGILLPSLVDLTTCVFFLDCWPQIPDDLRMHCRSRLDFLCEVSWIIGA